MTQQDSNPDPVGSVSKRDYLRLLLAAMGVGALSTASVETAKAAHLSDSPYPSGAWGYAPIASHGVSDRPSIAELEAAWSETYHFLNQDVDVGARYYAEKNDDVWDLLPIVWDSLDTPTDSELPASGMKIEDDGTQFRLVNITADASEKNIATLAYNTTKLTPTTVTWETAADWDAAQSESGVHHEQPADTDWAAADVIEKGYKSSTIEGVSAHMYYPLEEDTGTTTHDVSGNSRDASISGATVNQPALLGRTGYDLDGVDDKTERFGSSTSAFSDGVTLGGWFNWDGNQNRAVCFEQGGSNGFSNVIFSEFGNSQAQYRNDDNNFYNLSFTDPPANTWTLILVTITSGGTFSFYAVFESGGKTTRSTNTSVTYKGITNDDLSIGALKGGGQEFDGTASDCFLLTNSVTATQVDNIYNYFVNDSDYWTSKKTETGVSSSITVTTNTTIPSATSIDLTLFEDVGNDGTGPNTDAIGNNYDNSDTASLKPGNNETVDLSGFDGAGNTNAYWMHYEIGITNDDPTTTSPTIDSVSIDV